jgi:hypothetical protein
MLLSVLVAAASCIVERVFDRIRSLLGRQPKRSEADGTLDRALAEAQALDHYFFFSDHSDAESAAERLQQRGWTIQSLSLQATLHKWSLQVRQPGRVENLEDLQTELDLFAADLRGEYDGWQVPGVTERLRQT